MKTPKILMSVFVLTILAVQNIFAQTAIPSGGGSGGSNGVGQTAVAVITATAAAIPIGGGGTFESSALPFDLSVLTNRSALASLAVRNVDHLMVSIYAPSSATVKEGDSEDREVFVTLFTNAVKSLEEMVALVQGTSFRFKVFDTTQPVQVEVRFSKGNPTNVFYKDGNPPFQTLLYGSSYNGKLVSEKAGRYVLDEKSSHIKIGLNSEIRISLPGLVSGKAIHYSQFGYSYSTHLYSSENGEFNLPVDVVESGTLVLYGDFGHGNETIAVSLVTGKPIELKDVEIRILLENSPEIYTYNNPQAINVVQDSYRGYGINPLVIVKIDQAGNGMTPVSFSLRTTENIVPTAVKILNIATGEEVSGTLTPNGSGTLFLPNGEYHIIPFLPVKGVPVYNATGDSGKG